MGDTYQTSDEQIRDVGVRANYDLVADHLSTVSYGPLPAKSSGYEGYFDIDISNLGLENSIIDVDVWRQEITSVGGGFNRYEYLKLPYTNYLSNGTVQESAWHSVFYLDSVQKGPADQFIGPATLRIYYRNNVTTSAYPVFYYKVSNRNVLSV